MALKMKHRRAFWLVFALPLGCGVRAGSAKPVQAAAPTAPQQSAEAAEQQHPPTAVADSVVRTVLEQLSQRYESGDAHNVAEIFAVDGDMTTLSGGLLQGREEIKKFYAEAFAGPYRGSQLSLDIDKIRTLDDHLAIVDGRWKISGDKLPPAYSADGVFTMLLVTDTNGGSITAARMSIPRKGHTRGIGRSG